MAEAIWKYELPSMDCVIAMPRGARVLTVQRQDNRDCVWAVVDKDLAVDDTESRRFITLGTGWGIPDDLMLDYIATVQEGPFVWHISEARAVVRAATSTATSGGE